MDKHLQKRFNDLKREFDAWWAELHKLIAHLQAHLNHLKKLRDMNQATDEEVERAEQALEEAMQMVEETRAEQ